MTNLLLNETNIYHFYIYLMEIYYIFIFIIGGIPFYESNFTY